MRVLTKRRRKEDQRKQDLYSTKCARLATYGYQIQGYDYLVLTWRSSKECILQSSGNLRAISLINPLLQEKSIKDSEGVTSPIKWMRNLNLYLDEVRSIHVPLDHHSDFSSPGVEPVMDKRVCSPR